MFCSQWEFNGIDVHSFPTRRSSDLRERVLPFLSACGRFSARVADYEKFAAVVRLLDAGCIASRGACATADRKSTRLNSSHVSISYAVFCSKKKKLRPALGVSLTEAN